MCVCVVWVRASVIATFGAINTSMMPLLQILVVVKMFNSYPHDCDAVKFSSFNLVLLKYTKVVLKMVFGSKFSQGTSSMNIYIVKKCEKRQ